MAFNDLSKYVNVSVLQNKKMMVDERNGVNADFILRDLAPLMNISSIYSWNDSRDAYYNIFDKRVVIKSAYGDVYDNDCISDHTYIGKKVFGMNVDSMICIYRDGTANTKDWYDYDIIILIQPLISGLSLEFDGVVTVRSRDKMFCKFKYKAYTNKTNYFYY